MDQTKTGGGTQTTGAIAGKPGLLNGRCDRSKAERIRVAKLSAIRLEEQGYMAFIGDNPGDCVGHDYLAGRIKPGAGGVVIQS